MLFKAITCLLAFEVLTPIGAKFCKEFEVKDLDFFPLRHCQRSNKTVIVIADTETLEECADLTRLHRGLAFNFSPKNRREKNKFESKKNGSNDELHSCEVLECPEYRNFSSVINDTRFDYYSLYTRPAREFINSTAEHSLTESFICQASENATCVPSVGMFTLSRKRSNYSVAEQTCANASGKLAHIASEVRNGELSKLLRISTNSSMRERTAYVGLNETLRDKFFTSDSEPLQCFHYRAWAPGHPPEVRRPGCVAITPESSWKVFNCNRKIMFICELFTSGPNLLVDNLNVKCSTQLPNNRIIPRKTWHN